MNFDKNTTLTLSILLASIPSSLDASPDNKFNKLITPISITKKSMTSRFIFEDVSPFSKPITINPWEKISNDFKSRIKEIFELKDNWDNQGAKAINITVLKNIISIISKLDAVSIIKLSTEDITPSPHGTVSLEWNDDNDNFISLEIGTDEIAFFSELPDGNEPFIDNLPFASNDKLPKKLTEAIKLF